MKKDTCIKAGTYCPVCQGLPMVDCWHSSSEFQTNRRADKQVVNDALERAEDVCLKVEKAMQATDMKAAARECSYAIRAALADPVLRGWRPIESAPRDGTEIIVGFDVATVWIVHVAWYRDGSPESGADGPEDIGWWSYVRNCVSQEMLDDIYTPTHWMPLLKPPEVK